MSGAVCVPGYGADKGSSPPEITHLLSCSFYQFPVFIVSLVLKMFFPRSPILSSLLWKQTKDHFPFCWANAGIPGLRSNHELATSQVIR